MVEENYLQLNKIGAYRVSFGLSNYVWDIVIKMALFSKRYGW